MIKPEQQKLFMDALQTGYLGIGTDSFGSRPDSAKRLEAVRMSKAAFDNFMYKPNQIGKERVKAIFTGTSSDLPILTTNSFDVTYSGLQFDFDWLAAFKEVPIESGKGFFEIVTLDNASAVKLVPEGGKLALEKLTGSKLVVFVNKYGQAIQWTDEMIRQRQLGALLETAEAAVEAHHADKADRMYALLTAGATASTAYQSTTGNTQVDNDIDTLNKVYSDLIIANKDKFRGLNANVEVLAYFPITAKGRIERAMNKVINADGGGARVQFNIRRLYTLNGNLPVPATGQDFVGLFVIPQRKIQFAQEMAPTIYSEQDILSLSYIQTSWQYYGAGAGAISQLRRGVFA